MLRVINSIWRNELTAIQLREATVLLKIVLRLDIYLKLETLVLIR